MDLALDDEQKKAAVEMKTKLSPADPVHDDEQKAAMLLRDESSWDSLHRGVSL